jgi:hypothetical protein
VFRRITLVWCMWLTSYIYTECFRYVNDMNVGVRLETAAIVGAFLTPLTALMGFVTKIYSSCQGGSEHIESKGHTHESTD